MRNNKKQFFGCKVDQITSGPMKGQFRVIATEDLPAHKPVCIQRPLSLINTVVFNTTMFTKSLPPSTDSYMYHLTKDHPMMDPELLRRDDSRNIQTVYQLLNTYSLTNREEVKQLIGYRDADETTVFEPQVEEQITLMTKLLNDDLKRLTKYQRNTDPMIRQQEINPPRYTEQEIRNIISAGILNSFGIKDLNANDDFEAIGSTVSAFNHSCQYNATFMTASPFKIVIRTTRPVSKGDEICITYSEEFCRITFKDGKCLCGKCDKNYKLQKKFKLPEEVYNPIFEIGIKTFKSHQVLEKYLKILQDNSRYDFPARKLYETKVLSIISKGDKHWDILNFYHNKDLTQMINKMNKPENIPQDYSDTQLIYYYGYLPFYLAYALVYNECFEKSKQLLTPEYKDKSLINQLTFKHQLVQECLNTYRLMTQDSKHYNNVVLPTVYYIKCAANFFMIHPAELLQWLEMSNIDYNELTLEILKKLIEYIH